eukprot:3239426-Rhodomonas_salina.5
MGEKLFEFECGFEEEEEEKEEGRGLDDARGTEREKRGRERRKGESEKACRKSWRFGTLLPPKNSLPSEVNELIAAVLHGWGAHR